MCVEQRVAIPNRALQQGLRLLVLPLANPVDLGTDFTSSIAIAPSRIFARIITELARSRLL